MLENLEQRREKDLWKKDDLHCLMVKSNAVSLPPLFCHPGCDDGSVRFLICYIFGRRPKGGGGMAQVAQW